MEKPPGGDVRHEPVPPVPPPVSSGAAGSVALISMICTAMVMFRALHTLEIRYLFMLWNLFLAWLPLVFALAAVMIARKYPQGGALRMMAILAAGSAWLLFLPNSAYLTTDFIHLISRGHQYLRPSGFSYLVWYDIVLFFLFAWCGILLGYLSTLTFHRMMARRFGSGAGWLFAMAVSLLAGYGVFLGRIVRLNSWDAWRRPGHLLIEMWDNLHWQGAAFSLVYALLILATYFTLYHLQEGKR